MSFGGRGRLESSEDNIRGRFGGAVAAGVSVEGREGRDGSLGSLISFLTLLFLVIGVGISGDAAGLGSRDPKRILFPTVGGLVIMEPPIYHNR